MKHDLILFLLHKDPEIICSSEEHKELKWIAGAWFLWNVI